jgi:hypothetical protein
MSVQRDLKYEINSAGTVLKVSRFASTLRMSIEDESSDSPEFIHIEIRDLIEVLGGLEVLKDYVNEQHL